MTIEKDNLVPQNHEMVWDDLKFPATAINPPGQASDPGVEASTGLLLFAATGTELIYALAQMPHAWREGSGIDPHVHWTKTTSAAGNVGWRCRYKHIAIGGIIDAAWTDMGIIADTVAGTPDNDTADEHLISAFGDLDMTGKTISHCMLFEISRVGGDASDTYGADARLLEFDVHYEIDSRGSRQEFIK